MTCKCFHCSRALPEYGSIHIGDGDFVCSEGCKQGYETQKEHFFNNVVHDAQKTEDWLMGKG